MFVVLPSPPPVPVVALCVADSLWVVWMLVYSENSLFATNAPCFYGVGLWWLIIDRMKN